MTAIALALASSLAWGTADFLAGLQARARGTFAVLLVTQALGLAAVWAVALVLGGGLPADLTPLLVIVGGGLAGVCGLACFYPALAMGPIALVAPITSASVLVPLTFGLLVDGERPSALAGLGIAVAVAGVLLASRESADAAEGARLSPRALLLAAGAALGFGVFTLCLDRSSEGLGVADILLLLACARTASFVLLLGVAVRLKPERPTGGWRALVAVGVLDVGANALFAIASTQGLLAVVSVLGTLYPAVTVVLAFAVLRERLTAPQAVGVALTLAGVGAIAAG